MVQLPGAKGTVAEPESTVTVTGLDGPCMTAISALLVTCRAACDGYMWPRLHRWIHQWMDAA
ncbi:MAG: hypothetical protein NVSMB43_25860 [Pseudarthrobacter sp.]